MMTREDTVVGTVIFWKHDILPGLIYFVQVIIFSLSSSFDEVSFFSWRLL